MGMTPYTIFNPKTLQPYPLDPTKPVIGDRNQTIQIKGTTYDLQAKQEIATWLTAAAHYQHQKTTLFPEPVFAAGVTDPTAGTAMVLTSGVSQVSRNDSVDGYLRFKVANRAVQHKLVVGAMYYKYDITAEQPPAGTLLPYNILTKTPTLPRSPPTYVYANRATGTNQLLRPVSGEVLEVVVMASVRGPKPNAVTAIAAGGHQHPFERATTPSFGAVLEITRNLSAYGFARLSFQPSLSFDYTRVNLLPTSDAQRGRRHQARPVPQARAGQRLLFQAPAEQCARAGSGASRLLDRAARAGGRGHRPERFGRTAEGLAGEQQLHPHRL